MPRRVLRCNTPRQGHCHDESVPNKPKTPVRTVRVEDEIWEPAKAQAKSEGRNLSEVIRELLAEWIDPNKD